MARQTFKTTDVLRLDVETDPTGLVNLVQNPSGELGGWGWITSIVGSKVSGAGGFIQYLGVAGASWFTTEEMPVAAGQYVAAHWNAVTGTVANYFRARFEWINSAGALISSSTQTGYLATSSGVGNLGAQLAPAGTAWARLRIDLYATNTGTNPGSAHEFIFREVTVAKAATAGTLGASRANLVPNPSFETDAKGWLAIEGSIVRSTSQAYVGSASLRHTSSGTGSFAFQSLAGKRGVPVVGSASYTAQCRVRAASTSRAVRLRLAWYDATGVAIGSSVTAGTVTSVSTGWTQVTITASAPASAAFLAAWVEYGTQPGAGEQHYFDAFLVEQAATVGAYFDAATPDAGGWDYGPNSQAPLVVQSRTNLAPNPAPASTTGYTSSAASIGLVSSSLQIVPDGSSADSFASVGGDLGGMRLGMQAGKTYTVSADLLQNSYSGATIPERQGAIVVHHRIGAASWTVLTEQPAIGGGPDRGYLTFTLPAGTTEAFVRLYCGAQSALSVTRWAKVMLEEGSASNPYFDGSTADGTSDFAVIDRTWTGTANSSTSTETDTITLPYATAVNSNLGYLDPVQFLNVVAESHELRWVREELQVGTLNATLRSRTLDPATGDLIRTGRRARLMALVNGAWEQVIGGKLLEAETTYELKDPSIPDEKRARVVITLIDAGQPLANATRTESVATIGELPYVLEGAGVPWNVNGSGNQVPAAVVTSRNENSSALDQVALTRDTKLGYAWVSRRGVINAWDAASIPAGSPLVLDEDDYTDLDTSYSSTRIINEVNVTVLSTGTDGNTIETTYGPYQDAASIDRNGRFSKTFTATGLSKPQADSLAASILTANANPVVRVNSLQLAILTPADMTAWALLDLYDPVTVNNAKLAISDALRITKIEASVVAGNNRTTRWLIRLFFSAEGGVANPTKQPPVQSSANPDVGNIEMFGGPVAKIPPTKLLCDGASYAVASYPYLFAVIGYTWGGSGAFFNVPNFVDRFPIGAGTKALAGSGGSATKTIADTNLPATAVVRGGVTYYFNQGTTTTDRATNGGGQPLDVMNPWRAVNFVIRAV